MENAFSLFEGEDLRVWPTTEGIVSLMAPVDVQNGEYDPAFDANGPRYSILRRRSPRGPQSQLFGGSGGPTNSCE